MSHLQFPTAINPSSMIPDDQSLNSRCNTAKFSFSSDILYDNHILIVDDQSFNIDAMKIILKYHLGLDSSKYCTSALSGKKAL